MAQIKDGQGMTEAERKAKEREALLAALQDQKPEFRWTIEGATYMRDALMRKIEQEPEFGDRVVELASGVILESSESPRQANQLGKRYACLVCGTQALCTKAGLGITDCCGQFMNVLGARKLPSSD